MISRYDKAAPMVPAPERPTDERSIEQDQLQPQFNDTTRAASGQEKLDLTPEEARKLGERMIRSFMTPANRRRLDPWPIYEAAKRKLRDIHELTTVDYEELDAAISRYMRI